jgi:hypothetical protein
VCDRLFSYNIKAHVPSDVLENLQYIDPANLKSPGYLDEISKWTLNQKMMINKKKSKSMIFNYTRNYQFSSRLAIEGEILETVEETKLLGTILTNDLRWDSNTDNIVKKANMRMELLRRISIFGASWDELKNIYILYIRSLLEQSCAVWHSSLTAENSQDLERIQKCALKIIMQDKFKSYEGALEILDLESLSERRERLCLQFARKCLNNDKMKYLFPPNPKIHPMLTRFEESYDVNNAHTTRLQNSPIVYMQRLLNQT